MDRIQIQTVIIGAGQAGLSTGYHLARRGLPFLIVDAHPRIGDVWRTRWNSLRLFTAARYNGLPGMPFPAPRHYFPTKDEMADYLEAYAARFALPVRTRFKVDRLSRHGRRYLIESGPHQIEAEHVVIAMASYQEPRVPAFARDLDPDIVQLHSKAYRHPGQLRDGGVLIAGAGNSGAEIAVEIARSHRTWIAGRDTGQLPFRINGLIGRWLLVPFMLRVVFHRILTVDTPLGRKVRSKVLSHGGPLIRVKSEHLKAAGIERAARVTGVRNGRPLLEDGREMDVANVIWCTGFTPGFSWIDLPIFGEDGAPRHERGIATDEPGLYFVGLHFLYAMSSTMIHGVGRDANRIGATIAERTRAAASQPSSAAAIAFSAAAATAPGSSSPGAPVARSTPSSRS